MKMEGMTFIINGHFYRICKTVRNTSHCLQTGANSSHNKCRNFRGMWSVWRCVSLTSSLLMQLHKWFHYLQFIIICVCGLILPRWGYNIKKISTNNISFSMLRCNFSVQSLGASLPGWSIWQVPRKRELIFLLYTSVTLSRESQLQSDGMVSIMRNVQAIAKVISLILVTDEMWHTVRLYTHTYMLLRLWR